MFVRIDDYNQDCEQKRHISVQIEDFDVYSMDTTLAHIIVPMLKKLKGVKVGIPGDIIHEFHQFNDQKHLELGLSQKELDDLEFERAEQKWNEIMDKMIWSFEQAMNDYEDLYCGASCGDFESYEKKLAEGFNLFGRYYRSLWW